MVFVVCSAVQYTTSQLTSPQLLTSHWSLVWCNFSKLLRHLIMIIPCVPNFHHVFILPHSNLWQDMNLFYLHLVFLFRDDRCPLSSVRWCTRLTFQIWLRFPLKDFSWLKYTWTTRNPTKLNNKIINTINHHSNYFIYIYIYIYI